jgi:predicted PurR-regulated permease PerM
LMVYNAINLLMVAFAGLLISVFIRGIAENIHIYLRLPQGLSILITVISILATLVGIGYYLAPQLAEQFSELSNQLPFAIKSLQDHLMQYSWYKEIANEAEILADPSQIIQRSGAILRGATGALSSFFTALLHGLMILTLGLYFAAESSLYRRGILSLVPKRRVERMSQVLSEADHTLKWWIFGTVIQMFFVATLITLGLWMLDIPLALALGIIAFSLEFMPNIGPILAAVPALLIALTLGGDKFLAVLILYYVVQQMESYLLTPLVQRKAIKMRPALTLFVQIFLGMTLGILGLAVATPLTAIAIVFIKRLYIEDALGKVIY